MLHRSIVKVSKLDVMPFKESYYFHDLFLLSMYVISSDTLTQYENTKVTISFLSSRHRVSINKEEFYRDSRAEECMIFYLETFFSYSYYQQRPTLMIFFLFVHFFCYQRASVLISIGQSVQVKRISNNINVNMIRNRKIEKKFSTSNINTRIFFSY